MRSQRIVDFSVVICNTYNKIRKKASVETKETFSFSGIYDCSHRVPVSLPLNFCLIQRRHLDFHCNHEKWM